MSWEKIGVTVVSAPKSRGGGVYLYIPRKVVQAYDLITALDVEITIDRARRGHLT